MTLERYFFKSICCNYISAVFKKDNSRQECIHPVKETVRRLRCLSNCAKFMEFNETNVLPPILHDHTVSALK